MSVLRQILSLYVAPGHSTYKRVHGYKQWWIFCTKCLRVFAAWPSHSQITYYSVRLTSFPGCKSESALNTLSGCYCTIQELTVLTLVCKTSNKTVLKDQCCREYHRPLNCTFYMHKNGLINLHAATLLYNLLAHILVLIWQIKVFNLFCGSSFLF